MKKPELIHKINNRFFSFELWGVKRETPNEFTELGKAVEEFKKVWKEEMYKLFKIPQIIEWLSKKLR